MDLVDDEREPELLELDEFKRTARLLGRRGIAELRAELAAESVCGAWGRVFS